MSVELLRVERLTYIKGDEYLLNNMKFNIFKGEILALLGANGAGKTLILHMLKGEVKPTGALIYLEDRKVDVQNIKQEFSKNTNQLKMIFFDETLNNLPFTTVFDYLFFFQKSTTLFFSTKNLLNQYHEICNKLRIYINPQKEFNTLSRNEKIIIHLMKAYSLQANIIFIDDYSISGTDEENEQLIHVLTTLKKRGISIVFTTCKIEPFINFSDRFIVIRNGTHALTLRKEYFDVKVLEAASIGRLFDRSKIEELSTIDNQLFFQVEKLSYYNAFKNVSFKLHQKEILCVHVTDELTTTYLLEILVGLRSAESGNIYKEGKKLQLKSNIDALKNNIVYVPEHDITFPNLSIEENLIIPKIKNISSFLGIIHQSKKKLLLDRKEGQIKKMRDATTSFIHKNIIIQRALGDQPILFILIDPLKYMDVVSTDALLQVLHEIREEGHSAIIFSSNPIELSTICNSFIQI